MMSLSGGRPKKEDVMKAVTLSLGPDFMSDIVKITKILILLNNIKLIVETSDHA